MSGHDLKIQKQLPASPETVFDAWTNPKHMAGWLSPFGPAGVPKLDLKVGGEYQIDMIGEEKTFVHTGTYLEIDRPRKLVFTWFSEGTGQKETRVTLDFKSEAGGTLLTLTHEDFVSEDAKNNHQGGWTAIIDKLEGVLASQKAHAG